MMAKNSTNCLLYFSFLLLAWMICSTNGYQPTGSAKKDDPEEANKDAIMMALIDLIKEQGQMLKKQGDMLVKMQEGKTSPPESSAGVKSYYDSFLSTAQLVGINDGPSKKLKRLCQ
uniref:Uncharacterized protein n=1 Tax=Daphnia galeata TaxID=27404 RepID=A0A8J2WL10_9CRUS|nr:unnamed protein product [Daphnia galeata]